MPETGDLDELEKFVGGMLQSLEPRARRSLFRKVATTMRRGQQKRIRSQRNPDGTRFEPRKKPKKEQLGQYALKFLYPSGGSGPPRLVLMKSWRREGPLFTGYDVKAGGLRSFEWNKVVRFLPAEADEENKGAGKLRNRTTVRQRAMFKRIGRSGILQAGQNAHEAWAGFAGEVARVARVHQEGKFDRPARSSRAVRYAKRELLGLTAQEREDLLDTVIEHLAHQDI